MFTLKVNLSVILYNVDFYIVGENSAENLSGTIRFNKITQLSERFASFGITAVRLCPS